MRRTRLLASEAGVATSIVKHDVTGRHFRPSDAAGPAAQVAWALSHLGESPQWDARLAASTGQSTRPKRTTGNSWRSTGARWRPAVGARRRSERDRSGDGTGSGLPGSRWCV